MGENKLNLKESGSLKMAAGTGILSSMGVLPQHLIIFMATIKKKRISVHAQGGMLRHYFPDSTLKIIGFDRGFVWEGKLKPSNLSITYDIRIVYDIGHDPNIYVINPECHCH